jgi:hypothetical protein
MQKALAKRLCSPPPSDHDFTKDGRGHCETVVGSHHATSSADPSSHITIGGAGIVLKTPEHELGK